MTDPTPLLDKHLEIVKAATEGPWEWSEDDGEWALCIEDFDRPNTEPIILCGLNEYTKPDPDNAHHIVTADPQVMEAYIAVAKALKLISQESEPEGLVNPATFPLWVNGVATKALAHLHSVLQDRIK